MKEFVKKLENDPVAIAASDLHPPVVSYDPATEKWLLEEAYTYQDEGSAITAPDHFEFDLASIPRPIWWLIAPFELSISAPLIHDFLYRYRGSPPEGSIVPPRTYSRQETDLLFKRMMKEEGVWWWRRAAAYRAVRWFGGGAW